MAGLYYVIFVLVALVASVVFSVTGISGQEGATFATRAVSVIMLHLVFIVAVVVICRLKNKQLFSSFDLHKKMQGRDVLPLLVLSVVCILAFILLHNTVIYLFGLMGYSGRDLDDTIPNFGVFVLLVFAMAVLPAVSEELIFRGLIFKSLLPYGKWLAVVVSATLFSLYHMNPVQTVYQFLLGIVFALVYLRTGNMRYPMLLHFFNNFLILAYTYITQGFGEGSEIIMSSMMVIGTIVMAVGGALLIWKFLPLFVEGEKKEIAGRKAIDMVTVTGVIFALLVGIGLWIAVFSGGL